VVDGSRLASLGWTASIEPSGGSTPISKLTVNSGGNDSIDVVLNATTGHALPPGTVTIAASIPNGTGPSGYRTTTFTVPRLNLSLVSVNGTTISVAGPGIGSPSAYPDWFLPALAFVPALALIVGLLVYRWYRTR